MASPSLALSITGRGLGLRGLGAARLERARWSIAMGIAFLGCLGREKFTRGFMSPTGGLGWAISRAALIQYNDIIHHLKKMFRIEVMIL